MVKIQDPTVAFSQVVTARRRSSAASTGERFRLGLHGLECGSTSPAAERAAVIGASAWALKAEQVEGTVELIGRYGSNNLSNEPRRTGSDDGGQADVEKTADLHQHGRRRTTPDRLHPDSGGS